MVEDCRGLRYIALLIQQAGVDARPMHARELAAVASGQADSPVELDTRDELLDAVARKQLMARLEEIAIARDQACATDRLEKAAQLDAEYEQVADELRLAAGGGKRRGAFSDSSEKARKAVSKAIAEAIARIGSYPDIAPASAHFTSAIRKGLWLSYSSDAAWQVDYRPPPRK
jgi:hypothetical protein